MQEYLLSRAVEVEGVHISSDNLTFVSVELVKEPKEHTSTFEYPRDLAVLSMWAFCVVELERPTIRALGYFIARCNVRLPHPVYGLSTPARMSRKG